MKEKGTLLFVSLLFCLLCGFWSSAQADVSEISVTRIQFANTLEADGDGDNGWVSDGFKITGIAPWDLGLVNFSYPAGSTTGSGNSYLTSSTDYTAENGTLYSDLLWAASIESGDYEYDFLDSSSSPINGSPLSFSFTLNDMDTVDSTGSTPADSAYTGTTQPTFTFTSVDSSAFYRVFVGKYNEDTLVWASDFVGPVNVGDPVNVPMPTSDILLPNDAYRWVVETSDGDTLITSMNRAQSAVKEFFTGTEDGLADNISSLVMGFNRVRTNYDETVFFLMTQNSDGTVTLGLAPWDVQVRITGPDSFDQTFDGDDFYDQLFFMRDKSHLPTGTYTITVNDIRSGHSESFSADVDVDDSKWSMVYPELHSQMYQVPYNAYLNTDAPTFGWAELTGMTEYRLQVFSYSHPQWGSFAPLTIWQSNWITGTSATIPDALLLKDSAYMWRVETRDADGNRARGDWSPFFVSNDNDPLAVSGTITASGITASSDHIIRVEATTSENPNEGETLSFLHISSGTDTFAYTLHNVPRDTDVYIHALYDTDGSQSYSVGDIKATPLLVNVPVEGTAELIGQDMTLNQAVAPVTSFYRHTGLQPLSCRLWGHLYRGVQ